MLFLERHVADIVSPRDLDQRLPRLEAGGSNLGREDFANGPGFDRRDRPGVVARKVLSIVIPVRDD